MDPNVPTTAGADHLLALLAVVADPVAHKARLDELIAQEKTVKEQTEALNNMASSTRRQNTAAEALTIVLNKRKTEIDTREAELGEKVKGHEQATAAQKQAAQQTDQKFRQREADMARREAAVAQREGALKDRETAVKAAEDSAAAITERLQRQAAAVKVALAS